MKCGRNKCVMSIGAHHYGYVCLLSIWHCSRDFFIFEISLAVYWGSYRESTLLFMLDLTRKFDTIRSICKTGQTVYSQKSATFFLFLIVLFESIAVTPWDRSPISNGPGTPFRNKFKGALGLIPRGWAWSDDCCYILFICSAGACQIFHTAFLHLTKRSKLKIRKSTHRQTWVVGKQQVESVK